MEKEVPTVAEPQLDELLDELGKVSGRIDALDTDRVAMVRAARKAGASWARIGRSLNLSKQTAWEKYHRLPDMEETA